MSNLAFSKFVASRYLWSKRSEAFIAIITVISILGVAIGVMVLNIVMAVMTGFEYELKRKIVDADSHIVLRKFTGNITEWRQALDQSRTVPGVDSAYPFTYHQVLLSSEANSTGLLVKGIENDGAGVEWLLHSAVDKSAIEQLFASSTYDSGALPGIIVGRELSRKMALLTGSEVSLVSSTVGASPFGLVPRYKRFKVVGIYQSGLTEYEDGLAYIDLSEAQKFFRMGDSITGIDFQVKNIDQAPEIGNRIFERLGGLSSGFHLQNWRDRNSALWEAIKLEKRVYFIVLLLIIIMASFSIITTLIMIVIEKRKDIAILKTMGANTRSIGNIFRIQGSVIGALGTLLGLLLGYLGCLALRTWGFPIDERVFQMSTVPVRIEPLNFALVGIAAFLICCFATWYPARRASSLQPSDVLRYE